MRDKDGRPFGIGARVRYEPGEDVSATTRRMYGGREGVVTDAYGTSKGERLVLLFDGVAGPVETRPSRVVVAPRDQSAVTEVRADGQAGGAASA